VENARATCAEARRARRLDAEQADAVVEKAGEHAELARNGRAEYVARTDAEALEGFTLLSRTEGIIPALEPAHAIADLAHIRDAYGADLNVLVCLSGRGDKDLAEVLAR